MKQVMQSPSSCDKHLKDMNVKFLTNIKKPENLRKLKDSKSRKQENDRGKTKGKGND